MPWWVLAPVFAGGLLIGGVVVGVLSSSGDPVATGPVAAGAPVTVTVTPAQTSTEILVDQACLDSLAKARALLGDVGDIRGALGDAISHFSLDAVNQLLGRIDSDQAELRQAAAGCHVQIRLPDGSVRTTDVLAPDTATS